MGENLAKIIIATILNNPSTLFFSPSYRFNLIKEDPDDNKFVDCAIIANARYIVTDDSHYKILAKYDFPKVSCMGIDAFLALIKE